MAPGAGALLRAEDAAASELAGISATAAYAAVMSDTNVSNGVKTHIKSTGQHVGTVDVSETDDDGNPVLYQCHHLEDGMFHPGNLNFSGLKYNYAVCCDMGKAPPPSLLRCWYSHSLLQYYSHQAVMNLLSGIVADQRQVATSMQRVAARPRKVCHDRQGRTEGPLAHVLARARLQCKYMCNLRTADQSYTREWNRARARSDAFFTTARASTWRSPC